MFLYENKYGNVGTDHLTKPQFEVRGSGVFPTRFNPAAKNPSMPWYEIRGNHIFQTAFHPNGHSLMPMYEVRNNELHTTIHHESGLQPHAAFHLRQ